MSMSYPKKTLDKLLRASIMRVTMQVRMLPGRKPNCCERVLKTRNSPLRNLSSKICNDIKVSSMLAFVSIMYLSIR